MAGGAALGVALRIWVLVSSAGSLDGDEGVWGTMARHVLHGHFSTFMWGQSYGGTQEVVLTAPFVAVLGSTALAIRILPIALWAVAALLVWRIGRRLFGEPSAAFAAVLFWVWPTYFVWKSTRAHGFYGSTLVLGLLVVLAALRLREAPRRWDLALLGVSAGCGLWASPNIAILAVPAMLWLVVGRPEIVREAWVVVGAACVGALPWLVANMRGDWQSLSPGVPRTDGIANLHNLAVATLPTALGLRVPFSLRWIGGSYLGPLLYLGCLVLLAVNVARHRRSLALPALAIALFPILYYVSPFTWINDEPRYLTELSPMLALVAGRAINSTGRAAVILASAVALTVAGFGFVQRDHLAATRAEGDSAVVPRHFASLISTLRSHGIRHVFADYWVAWRITYESRETIIGAATTEVDAVVRSGRVDPSDTTLGRFPAFYRDVRADRSTAHVFLVGGGLEQRAGRLLRRTGYRRIAVGGFLVYLPPSAGTE